MAADKQEREQAQPSQDKAHEPIDATLAELTRTGDASTAPSFGASRTARKVSPAGRNRTYERKV